VERVEEDVADNAQLCDRCRKAGQDLQFDSAAMAITPNPARGTSISYYWLNGNASHKFYAPSFIHKGTSPFLFLEGNVKTLKLGPVNPFKAIPGS
jgi:hypothetical protein